MKPPRTQKATDDDKWPKLSWKDKKKRWLLDGRLGRGGAKGGRKWWFINKDAAEKKRTELRAEHAVGGSDALTMTPAERIEAQTCRARLAERGKTLADATDFYIKHLEQTQKTILWSGLVTLIVDSKTQDGRAGRYTEDLESRLTMLATDKGDRPVTDYTTDELDKWLRAMTVRKPGHKDFGKPIGPTSRNNTRRLLVLAFNEAISRGFASTNPAEKIPIATRPRPEHDDDEGEDEAEVTLADILYPVEVAALLLVAEPPLVPYLALAAFCGLRRAELRRIAWRRVDFDTRSIHVPGRVAKRDGRDISLRSAYDWLLPQRGSVGLITTKAFRESLDRARAAAVDLLEPFELGGNLKRWPANCLRHGFASYHYSAHRDAKTLAYEMGHRSTDLIFRVYREPAPRELAEQFWRISPTIIALGRTGGIPALLAALQCLEDTGPGKAQNLTA